MRIGEFIEAVDSYGVRVPSTLRDGRTNSFYDDILELDHLGHGHYRDYTNRMVRRMVAWQLVGDVSGLGTPGNHSKPSQSAPQRRHAARLLAAAPEGYVVMADGRAWWSLVEPVHALRTKCAVAVPVPQWRH